MAQVRAAVEGKERAAAELLEVERQIMATERKIELEKELQAAYAAKDEGEDVMAGMKKEIHRMELRYAQLMRRQEELMVEMERSIFKRDMIGVRGKLTASKGASKSEAGRAVAELSKRAADMEAEIGRYERQIRELDAEGAQVGQAMEETGAGIKELQREEEEVHRQMYALDRRKKALKEDVYRLQKMAKRYQGLQGGTYEPKDAAEVDEGLARAQERQAALRQVHPPPPATLAPPRLGGVIAKDWCAAPSAPGAALVGGVGVACVSLVGGVYQRGFRVAAFVSRLPCRAPHAAAKPVSRAGRHPAAQHPLCSTAARGVLLREVGCGHSKRTRGPRGSELIFKIWGVSLPSLYIAMGCAAT